MATEWLLLLAQVATLAVALVALLARGVERL